MDSQVKRLSKRQNETQRPIWVHTHVGGILDQFRRTLQLPLSESFRVPLRWPHWSIDGSWLMWSCFPLRATIVWSSSGLRHLVSSSSWIVRGWLSSSYRLWYHSCLWLIVDFQGFVGWGLGFTFICLLCFLYNNSATKVPLWAHTFYSLHSKKSHYGLIVLIITVLFTCSVPIQGLIFLGYYHIIGACIFVDKGSHCGLILFGWKTSHCGLIDLIIVGRF